MGSRFIERFIEPCKSLLDPKETSKEEGGWKENERKFVWGKKKKRKKERSIEEENVNDIHINIQIDIDIHININADIELMQGIKPVLWLMTRTFSVPSKLQTHSDCELWWRIFISAVLNSQFSIPTAISCLMSNEERQTSEVWGLWSLESGVFPSLSFYVLPSYTLHTTYNIYYDTPLRYVTLH